MERSNLRLREKYIYMRLDGLTQLFIWKVVVMVMAMAMAVKSDPQINLLNKGCSQYNATNIADFSENQNQTFSDLRASLLGGKYFATSEIARTSDPVYAMVQCRNYMTTTDCVTCFDAAQLQIRNCSAANGARVIYDGCFLRYESNTFYDQTTLPGNTGLCSNHTASQVTAFYAAAQEMLANLEVATPKIKDFYAAIKQQVGSDNAVYGIAQCAESVSESGCLDCLKVAYTNIQGCPPNADARAIDAACFMRYSETPFFADNQTVNITPFLSKGGSSKKSAIIGGVVGGIGLVLLIIAVFIWYQQSRKAQSRSRGDILGATELQGPVNYSYKDLKSATKNFSEEYKLGEGGFGDVYKGILKNGKIVAVKRLTIGQSSRAKADFETEVKLISNVHHRNLIRLLGCCSKGPELILVYEYMANSSLDKFLFGDREKNLNWKQRFDIIYGMARGLAFLHEEFHVCIIHRDIKTNNILLDDDFQPKIADFGLARLLPQDKSHISTRFAGTLGYTAPEYAIHGQLSEKVDTYSFGVVVLEIISGQRSNELTIGTVSDYLIARAWKLYENEKHLELVDESLDPNEYTTEDAMKLIEIALLCVQSSASVRPTMTQVVVMLLSKGPINRPELVRPTFLDPEQPSDHHHKEDKSTSTASYSSNATMSTTQVSAR